MSGFKLAAIAFVGLLLGGTLACGDDDDGGEGGPMVCYDMVDACDACPTGLTCGALSAGGFECYIPCDTASDCGGCETETVCGYGEGDRMLCVEMP